MRVTISQAFVSFLLSSICLAFEASAQSANVTHLQPDPGPSTPQFVVSAELLRHPVPPKVRQRILRALEEMESGDHETAIHQLIDTLVKYPVSAPYVHSLLGVEYVKTDRFGSAVSSFEKAVTLLPNDAMTHYQFGLALICVADFSRATREVQRAVELDPHNLQMQTKLNAILARQRSGN